MEKVRIVVYTLLSILITSCKFEYNHKVDKIATEITIWGADSAKAIRFHNLCAAEIDSLKNLPAIGTKKINHLSAYFCRIDVYAFISAGMIEEAVNALCEYEKKSTDAATVSIMRPCLMSYVAFLDHNSEMEEMYKKELIESYRKICEAHSGRIKRDLNSYICMLNNDENMPITTAMQEYLEDYFFLKRTGTIAESWVEYESYIRSLGISDDLKVYKQKYLTKDNLVIDGFLPKIVYERWL